MEQGELSAFIVPTNAGSIDETADEPQPTTSRPKKRAATRPPAKSTAKNTKNARQTKRKGAAVSKPEPASPHEATPAPAQDRADDKEQPNRVLAVRKKTAQSTRQGTRSSARLRGKNVTAAHDEPVAKAEVKRTKRAREADTDKKTTELPEKRAKRADDRTDAPAQAEATTSDNPSADPVPSEDDTVDDPEQPDDTQSEESEEADEDQLVTKSRFYLRDDPGMMPFLFLGTVLDR